MSKFIYKAKAGPGNIREGVIEAVDQASAVAKIVQSGFIPLDVREDAAPKAKAERNFFAAIKLFSGIRIRDLSVFLRQLSDLLDAEIPILRALQLIGEQTKNPAFKAVVQKLRSSVQEGDYLSQAMSARQDIFPAYFIFMIRSGETSGRLKTVLNRLCELTEKQEETMSRIRASLVYPALIFFVGFLTVFVILTFVIPRLAVMFDDMDQELPMITQFLIAFSSFLSVFWWVPLLLLIGFVVWVDRTRKTPAGKLLFDRLLLKVPLLGNFLKTQELERLARTMGTMMESGVEVVLALESVQGVINNEIIKAEFKKISQAVVQGSSLAAAFQASPMFPADVITMIGVGEESGRVHNGFLKWAESYERESERMVKTVTTLLEPAMILIIGGMVGFMVIAMLLPIFKMNLIVN